METISVCTYVGVFEEISRRRTTGSIDSLLEQTETEPVSWEDSAELEQGLMSLVQWLWMELGCTSEPRADSEGDPSLTSRQKLKGDVCRCLASSDTLTKPTGFKEKIPEKSAHCCSLQYVLFRYN